jgi:predicted transporter
VSIKLFGGGLGTMPALGVLTLTVLTLPEPGTLGLWGLGVVALGAFGRMQRARSDRGMVSERRPPRGN